MNRDVLQVWFIQVGFTQETLVGVNKFEVVPLVDFSPQIPTFLCLLQEKLGKLEKKDDIVGRCGWLRRDRFYHCRILVSKIAQSTISHI